MGIAHERKILAFAMPALLLSSLSLGECATATAGPSLMDARAQAVPTKKSIFDPPPQREPAMTLDERQKMQKELNAARDHQTPNAKAKAHPVPSAQPAKPQMIKAGVRAANHAPTTMGPEAQPGRGLGNH